MSTLTGLTHQPGTEPEICDHDSDDRELFFTIGEIDMPSEPQRATIGVALFGLPEVEDASNPQTYAELAKTANKWCGFGRGDVNNDDKIDLVDIAYLIDYVYYGGNGPFPFKHLGDVDPNYDGMINDVDIATLIDFYFNFNGCITGRWILGNYPD
jgi:hypothetical protein